jgi:hypothetical protein
MTFADTCAGLPNLASNQYKHTNMKRKKMRCSTSTSRFMKSTSSTYEAIYARCEKLIELLHEPHTIAQLCTKTGQNYRTVYRDLTRLLNLGYKLKNNLNTYWIDFTPNN